VPKNVEQSFIERLRAREAAAWFELWEDFGPILRAQLARWGRGRIGPETVQDLSQETLTALAGAIDRHDPNRGARFSTWLLAIARHTLGDEMDRRMAKKRGEGRRPVSLEDAPDRSGASPSPDAIYESQIFQAKVAAALRWAEREAGFADFSVYRMRALEGRTGRAVAQALGMSEAKVSRRLAAVRGIVRERLSESFSKYSFTEEERAELERNGLELNPNKRDEVSFDEAVAEIFHRWAKAEGKLEAETRRALSAPPEVRV